MLPTINIFGKTIAMYGLMIAIGLIIGISIAVIRSKKHGFKNEDVLFASFFGCIGLFAGAKLLYVLIMLPKLVKNLEQLITAPDLLLPYYFGGFVFYGGLIGAVAGIYIYCRLFNITFLPLLDHLIPSIPVIHGFGRLGCFFAGCCYGIPYLGTLGITFHNSISAPNNISLFPVQLMESGTNIIAGIFLLIYSGKSRHPGKITGLYILYYAFLRFSMEFLRGDVIRGSLLGLSTSQWISLFIIPFGIILLVPRTKNNPNK
jgi:phosphatidylglycerol:prolipoprotein diacylglycerol transferase